MADVNILDATGATVAIATEQVADSVFGTAQVQFVKLIDGTNGGTARAAVDASGNLQVAPVALVSDTPSSYLAAESQPLSMTPDGRLRVASVQADVTRVWQTTFEDPWGSEQSMWRTENIYV